MSEDCLTVFLFALVMREMCVRKFSDRFPFYLCLKGTTMCDTVNQSYAWTHLRHSLDYVGLRFGPSLAYLT